MKLFNFFKRKSPSSDSGLFSGGNGTSFDDAIVIHTKSSIIGIPLERRKLAELYGTEGADCTLEQRYSTSEKGRSFDVYDIRFKSGTTASVYFDITNFFGKM
ncbi:MAG: hypothetical protein H7A55_22740 [Verrucomicrobiaceae bacterium]|nr:hypothetical protein [Verrucomicrobiaceae bacterium]